MLYPGYKQWKQTKNTLKEHVYTEYSIEKRSKLGIFSKYIYFKRSGDSTPPAPSIFIIYIISHDLFPSLIVMSRNITHAQSFNIYSIAQIAPNIRGTITHAHSFNIYSIAQIAPNIRGTIIIYSFLGDSLHWNISFGIDYKKYLCIDTFAVKHGDVCRMYLIIIIIIIIIKKDWQCKAGRGRLIPEGPIPTLPTYRGKEGESN